MRLALAACLAAVLAFPPAAAAINNGQPDGDGHPSVGAMLVSVEVEPGVTQLLPGCGGALIEPRLFLTAAHCVLAGQAIGEEPSDIAVTFNPDGTSPDGRLAVADWFVHPDANPLRYANLNDVAVLVLAEPHAGPYHTLPAELALEGMDLKGVSFELVGYGSTANPQGTGKPGRTFFDQRQVATAPFQSLTQTFLKLLENTKQTGEGGACSGDSGSPVLLPGQDVVYATTTGGNAVCRSTAQKQRLDLPVVRDWLLGVLAAVN